VDEISAKLDNIQKKSSGFSRIGDSLVNVGKQMTIMGAAITAPFVGAVKTFAEFEQSMKNVQVVSGLTGEELKRVTQAAEDIGKTTKYSAKQAAEGLYSLASAGLNAEEQVKALKSVTDLAAATNYDFARTSEVMVSTVNQFGIGFENASRVSDVFAKAIGGSMANMEKLSNAFRQVGSAADALGYDLEDTTAYLMALYDSGYKGEQAGVALRNALASLVAPTTTAADTFSNLGISIDSIKGSSDPLREALIQLGESGASTADLMAIFGKETGPKVASLLKIGIDAIDDYEDSLRNSAGASADAAKEQMNTFDGMLKRLKSQFEGIAIEVGRAVLPIAENIVKFAKSIMDAWEKVPQPLKEALTKFTAIGGIILTVGGAITMMVGGIMKSIKVWQEFGAIIGSTGKLLRNLATRFTGLSSGIGGSVTKMATFQKALATGFQLAGVAALLAIIVKLGEKFKEFNDQARTINEEINEKMGDIVDTSKKWYENIWLVGDWFHNNRITSELQEMLNKTSDNTDEFIKLYGEMKKSSGVRFDTAALEMRNLAETTANAGGMYNQFGQNVDLVKKALVEMAIQMENQGEPIEQFKNDWKEVLPEFDTLIEKEKQARDLSSELASQLTNAGDSGREAAENIQKGIEKVDFTPVNEKAGEFAENIAQTMADAGTMSRDEIMAKMVEVDFSFLERNATDTATKMLEKFKNAGATSFEALNNINNLGFETLELTMSEIGEQAEEHFSLMGKNAVRGLGVINDLSFTSLDEEIAQLSKNIVEALTNAGVNSVLAMEVLNDIDFSGMKPTIEETKEELISYFEKAGYSSKEAVEKVNDLNLEKMIKESQKGTDQIKTQFKNAAEESYAQLQELNNFKLEQLQKTVDSFNTDKQVAQIDRVINKIDELNGKKATIIVEYKEVEV
jgi:TP901 family phage tail tape measure protein